MALEEQQGEQSSANPGTGEGSPSEGSEDAKQEKKGREDTGWPVEPPVTASDPFSALPQSLPGPPRWWALMFVTVSPYPWM